MELHAEPIPLKSAVATYQNGDADELASVIDGVEAGPRGWSVAPRIAEPQAMLVRTDKVIEAAELDVSLYFLSGRPNNCIAEFALCYTVDDQPSLDGNWEPLPIQRFAAEVMNLRRVGENRLRADQVPDVMTGMIPDDTYRMEVLLPKGRASGFRLEVFPVRAEAESPLWMSWGTPHDFVLTEFRVEEHVRATTNIALHCAVRASHPLFQDMQPGALTDGLPATIAHPADETPNPEFHFDLDLGRGCALDHIGLRGRGDGYLDRLSRLRIRIYQEDPQTGAMPVWEGIDRPDGSYPAAGEVDVIGAHHGKGSFSGRYLRLSTDSQVPLSPQLAEVEVYETRAPQVVAAYADGREIAVGSGLELPPGVRRISLRLRIPQLGMPSGDAFRWRLRGDLEQWQTSRLMTIEMPCPPAGKTFFEAQAVHSDRRWDGVVMSLPILARRHFWESPLFLWLAGSGILVSAMLLARFLTKRRSARLMALIKVRASLAEERTRIARDLHDDLGANLARIGILTELAERSLGDPARAHSQLQKIYTTAHDLTRQLDLVVWTVDPANDTLESLARYLHGHAEEYLGIAGIRCHFTSTDAMPVLHLSSTCRHHLLMIVKEALHNIVTHAGATVVTLGIGIKDGQLLVEIADNGRGMPPPGAMKPGNGLENMKSRAAAIGGSCEFLKCEADHGVLVRLVLPLHYQAP